MIMLQIIIILCGIAGVVWTINVQKARERKEDERGDGEGARGLDETGRRRTARWS